MAVTDSTALRYELQDPDVRLMLEVRDDNAAAFEELMLRYQNRLISVMEHLVGRRDMAEDLTQDVFLRVYRARGRYRPKGKFAAWIYRTAARVATNFRNRSWHALPLNTESLCDQWRSPNPGVDEGLQQQERADIVDWALGRLPDVQRLVIVLRHYEGMKFSEIAQAVSSPISTVKGRFQAGLQRLYAILKNSGYLSLEE